MTLDGRDIDLEEVTPDVHLKVNRTKKVEWMLYANAVNTGYSPCLSLVDRQIMKYNTLRRSRHTEDRIIDG